jgi:glycolate oxidase FAD binding subunit
VSGVSNATSIEREMRAICGEEHVSESAPVVGNFRPDHGRPVLVVTPASAEEVAAVLQFANAHGLSIFPEGGMTAGCIMAESDVVLQTSRLVEVEHYDHADLTVGVGAGTTVAQLSAMVAEDSLLFACDPPFPERASIGGVLATAGHGPLRHGYGALRDFCIGMRFVTGDGRRAKGGGRVVKNVAGYDLMKLLIGSYGTLAVITSASFKLFPAPRQTRTFLAEFGSAAEALQFRDLVVRSPLAPMCLELISPGARKLMRPEMTSDAWVICMRAAGSDTVLARYRRELGTAIARELGGEDESRMWRAIAHFPVTPCTDSSQALGMCLSIFVPPADVALVLTILQDNSRPELADIAFVGRVGIGHLLVSFRLIDIELTSNAFANGLIEALPQSAQARSGLFGAGTRAEPTQSDSMRAVKQALDPRNVLRGRKVF